MNILLPDHVCCVIITYKPSHDLINLLKIIGIQAGRIIVVDNNSDNLIFNSLKDIAERDNLFLIENSKNLGIAKALNQGVIKAKELGYDWVVTFDQDSKPFSNIIEILLETYNDYCRQEEIGAIGINFLIENGFNYYPRSIGKRFYVKDYLITSGCLLSIKVFFEIGGFREDYFIDNVDLEYSLRLGINNKVMLITDECGMYHNPGAPLMKVVAGIKIVSSNHNSLRRYYMAKNNVLMSKSYFFKRPYFIAKTNFFFVLAMIKFLLIEENKREKFCSTVRGLKDGLLHSSKFVISIKDEN